MLGKTDATHQFHLIAIAVTSHETMSDFELFYKGVIELCKCLKIKTGELYIMQDASKASYSAAKSIFGDKVKVLMCWYHVRANIKKHLHLVPKHRHDEISNEIMHLHMQKDMPSFRRRWQCFHTKWSPVCDEFVDYFFTTWVNIFA